MAQYNNPMKKRKQRPNYFRRQEDNLGGTNFLSRKTPVDLQRDAIIIFRDIARGNIDLQKDIKYFVNAQFTSNIHKVAYDLYMKNYMNQTAVTMYLANYASQLDDQTKSTMQGVNADNITQTNIYGILSAGLSSVINLISSGHDENSEFLIQTISSLTNKLYEYRYNI